MKRTLVVIYDDNDLHALYITDPYQYLPNGNHKVINIIIGDYADELYHELIKGAEQNEDNE